MVNWKIAFVVIIIVALVIAIGMWFGYQYASEQDDISSEGWLVPSNTTDSLVLIPTCTLISRKSCLFEERRSKI